MSNEQFKVGDPVVLRASEGQGAFFRIYGEVTDITKSFDGRPMYKVPTNIMPEIPWWQFADEIRHETFMDYITRPTGFGKTPWPLFAIIVGFSLVLLGYGTWGCPPDENALILTPGPDGWVGSRPFNAARFICYLFGLGIPAVLVWGTWMNFKGLWK